MPPNSGGALTPPWGGRLMYIHSVGAKHYLVIYEANWVTYPPFQFFHTSVTECKYNFLFNRLSRCLSVNSSLDHSLETKPALGAPLNSKGRQGRLPPLRDLNSSLRYLNPAGGGQSPGAWWVGAGV